MSNSNDPDAPVNPFSTNSVDGIFFVLRVIHQSKYTLMDLQRLGQFSWLLETNRFRFTIFTKFNCLCVTNTDDVSSFAKIRIKLIRNM